MIGSNEVRALVLVLDEIEKALEGIPISQDTVKVCGGKEYDGVRKLTEKLITIAQTIQDNPSGGGGGGTMNHAALSNRNIAGQHTMDAIVGLLAALNEKANNSTLGSAAEKNEEDFASAEQGAKADSAHAAINNEAAARAQGDSDTLAAANQYTNDTVAASQTWLPAVPTQANLPTVTDTSKTYLCRVVSENNVYQCVAGQTAWEPYSENTDYVDELELAAAISVETSRATGVEDGLRSDMAAHTADTTSDISHAKAITIAEFRALSDADRETGNYDVLWDGASDDDVKWMHAFIGKTYYPEDVLTKAENDELYAPKGTIVPSTTNGVITVSISKLAIQNGLLTGFVQKNDGNVMSLTNGQVLFTINGYNLVDNASQFWYSLDNTGNHLNFSLNNSGNNIQAKVTSGTIAGAYAISSPVSERVKKMV